MPPDPSRSIDPKLSPHDLVQRLKEEIGALTDQQTNALQAAIYVGMTPDEAKKYDARRQEISRLIAELANLQKAG